MSNAAVSLEARPARSAFRIADLWDRWATSAVAFVVFLVLWQLVAQYVVKQTFKMPSPVQIATGMWPLLWNGELPIDIETSMFHFVLGVGLAIVVGVPLGAVTGWFRPVDRALSPIIELIRPIPPIAWIPFAIVWLHLTHWAAAAIIFIGAVFPILLNTYAGFRSVSRTLVEAATLLGARDQTSIIRKVAIPAAVPSMATGLRIGMGVGWVSLVAAEMFGVSETGLGFKVWNYYNVHAMELTLGYMLIVGAINLVIDSVFRAIVDRRLLRWRTGLVT